MGYECTQDLGCFEKYEICEEQKCRHRDLMPFRPLEVVGMFLFTAMVAVSNFAGAAGGFAYIAMQIMFNLNLPMSIVFNNAKILIAAVMRLPKGIGNPHPLRTPHGTLFNFHVVSLTVPMCSLGATLATLVARVVPDLYL